MVEKLFEENGAIASQIPGYEVRPQQIRMAEAVEDAIKNNSHLIVEAGTGVGKSWAYLVPFIEWAVKEKKRVVVSTYTKALQNQLFVKDLPFLSRALGVDFRYALCMGADNYACLRKAHASLKNKADFSSSTGDARGCLSLNTVCEGGDTRARQDPFARKSRNILSILDWLKTTTTGLVTDLDFEPDKSLWSKFARSPETCLASRCSFKRTCFYKKARSLQSKAHVLITNHALLFADMASGSDVLPEFNALVLDEAHTVENVATDSFTSVITRNGVNYLVEDMSSLSKDKSVRRSLESLKKSSRDFFGKAETILTKDKGPQKFSSEKMPWGELKNSLDSLSEAILDLIGGIKDLKDEKEFSLWEAAKREGKKCETFSEALELIFKNENPGYVYWAEAAETAKSGVNYSFSAAPIDVSGILRRHIFERISPVVLTSATLRSSGAGFGFLKERLGIDSAREVTLFSPFDYEKNVLMYLPSHVSDPNTENELYKNDVVKNIIEIYDCLKGRTFALFTSYEMLNFSAGAISGARPDIEILKQGDLPRYVLLDVFKRKPSSLLLGTTTFWQGVDVPGSALECVIITKLPFSVPSDPINSARINAVRAKGLEPFNSYQVPEAVIMFKQGFGRLIRSKTDRGVVAVLDPRIQTRRYGKIFIESVPKCRYTGDINDVKIFFS